MELIRLQVSYPDIKADKQFTQLADELAGTENRIAFARTRYNDVVKSYNTKVSLFPTSIVAGMKGATRKTTLTRVRLQKIHLLLILVMIRNK